MSVSNGQTADQNTFNNAFMSRTVEDTTTGKKNLANADAASGTAITNAQRELNKLNSFLGSSANTAYNTTPTWTNNDVGLSTDDVKTRADNLTAEFDATTGHTHSGAAGEGPQISASVLADYNDYWAEWQTDTYASAAGLSDDVTTVFTGLTPGGGASAAGVPTAAPYNRVELRTDPGEDQIEEPGGRKVYGRVTESGGTWTLTYYYLDTLGVETAYSLPSQNIRLYWTEVFDSSNRPTFGTDQGFIGSEDATRDVTDASATQPGKVTTGAQTFAGDKTFNGNVVAAADIYPSADNSSIIGDTGSAFSQVYTYEILASDGTNFADVANRKLYDSASGEVLDFASVLQPNVDTVPSGNNTLDLGSDTAEFAEVWAFDIKHNDAGTPDLNISTTANNGDINLVPHGTGIVDVQSAAKMEALAYVRSDQASGGTITNLSSSYSYVKFTGASTTELQGIVAPTIATRILLHNSSTGDLTIKHQNAGASAADRLITSDGLDLVIAQNSSAEFVYDLAQARWVVAAGSGAGGANTALSNLDATTLINTSLVSDTNNTDDLGTDAIEWKDAWVHNIKHGDASNPNLTISTTSNNGNVKISPHGTGYIDADTNLISNVVDPVSAQDAATKNYVDLYGGGSGGAVNLLGTLSAKFTTDTGSWTGFDEGAVSTPADLTGGSPSQLTFARGTAFSSGGNLRITHAAADAQGEGLSLAFTVDTKYFASVMDIEFDYQNSSGYADDKLEVWIYDATNSTLIQPSVYKIKSSTMPETFKAQFQTSATGTSYRIGFFCPNTTATSYTLDLDDIRVGPSVYNYGMPGSDWVSYTPTLSDATGTASLAGRWRRIGDSIEITGTVRWTAGGGGSSFTVSLPTGYTIDTSKLPSGTDSLNGTTTSGFGGSFHWKDVSVSDKVGITGYHSSTSFRFTEDGDTNVNNLVGTQFANGDTLGWSFRAPILGWSSSIQMSSDADQRETSAIYYTAAADSISNTTTTIINFATKSYDSHNAVTTGASWKYTCPTSGRYNVNSLVTLASGGGWAAGEQFNISINVNGAEVKRVLNAQQGTHSGTVQAQIAASLSLNADDYIDVRVYQNSGGAIALNGNASDTYIDIHKVQGPSSIGANEKIVSRYETAAAQSISNATTTIIDYGTKSFDSHGSVTTGASWKFTAPISGEYMVEAAAILSSSASWSAGEDMLFMLYKNGVHYSYLDYKTAYGATSTPYFLHGSDCVQLLSGEYVDIRISQSSGASISLGNFVTGNYVNIRRHAGT